ncbi:hypothetical protein AABD61_10115 [Edwardsiella piscicida]|uniref:hypothetical protein n=1 Tax=Edwardsiella piscicida TaxID=1263550 RepID=UPI00370D2C5C
MMNNELANEITADEEMGVLIAQLKYYAAKPDMAVKQLPHLLSLVSSAAAGLQGYRKAAKAPPVRYLNKFSGVCVTLEQQPNAATDSAIYQPLYSAQQQGAAIGTADLIYKFYERYPLNTFKSDSERAEALGYFMAGAELQCYGDFIAYEGGNSDE